MAIAEHIRTVASVSVFVCELFEKGRFAVFEYNIIFCFHWSTVAALS